MVRESKSAARFGALAERKARERYDLEDDHSPWHDARAADGRPVEIKAAMLNRSSGKRGRFRIFEKYHSRLVEEGGIYVFVAYRAVGRGIRIERMKSVEADSVRASFYGAGGHRGSRQVKVPPAEIF
jgi:hypothetical protein